MVGNFLSNAGGRRFVCEDLAERLREAGWTVLVTSDRTDRVGRVLAMLKAAWSRRNSYAVSQVDVYSGAAFVWAAAVSEVLRRLGKPFVLSLHGGNLPAFARRWPRLVRRTLSSANVVTAPSEYLIRAMKPHRANIVLIPNPLDLGKYPREVRLRARPRLLWLRAFHSIYNPVLGPKVLALLARDRDATLTMVGPDKGDGSLPETLRTAAALGVADRLRVVPGVPRTELRPFFAEADVFLNTTDVDNTPVSVMEAMACGLCVVSTNVGGLPHLIEEGRDGILVPPNDPDAMAGAVRRIVDEPALASKLSANARRRAEDWDWQVLLPKWEALFRELADA
jgi:glycosyltransferase involved in cell wall biosynthesis